MSLKYFIVPFTPLGRYTTLPGWSHFLGAWIYRSESFMEQVEEPLSLMETRSALYSMQNAKAPAH